MPDNSSIRIQNNPSSNEDNNLADNTQNQRTPVKIPAVVFGY